MTNREAIKIGLIPCESDRLTGDISFLKNEFHGVAVITVQIPAINGERDKNPKLDAHESLVHVCFNCATKHFDNCTTWQSGVVWPE